MIEIKQSRKLKNGFRTLTIKHESDFEGIEDEDEKEDVIIKELDYNTCYYVLKNGGVLVRDY